MGDGTVTAGGKAYAKMQRFRKHGTCGPHWPWPEGASMKEAHESTLPRQVGAGSRMTL